MRVTSGFRAGAWYTQMCILRSLWHWLIVWIELKIEKRPETRRRDEKWWEPQQSKSKKGGSTLTRKVVKNLHDLEAMSDKSKVTSRLSFDKGERVGARKQRWLQEKDRVESPSKLFTFVSRCWYFPSYFFYRYFISNFKRFSFIIFFKFLINSFSAPWR